MPQYIYKVEFRHTFVSYTNEDVVIDAENEEAAEGQIRGSMSRDHGSGWDADHEDTDVESYALKRVEDIDDSDKPAPRCPLTKDMFNE